MPSPAWSPSGLSQAAHRDAHSPESGTGGREGGRVTKEEGVRGRRKLCMYMYIKKK